MVAKNRQPLQQIVIIGGGAGGLELATKLGDKLGRRKLANITLIDAKLTHLWKPLLHEVAAGTLNSNDDELSYLAQAHWHHFFFQAGYVDGIDRKNKRINIASTFDTEGNEYLPRRTIYYDILIIAVGSVSRDFGIQGVNTYCHFIDKQEQAEKFHRHLLSKYYSAHTQTEDVGESQLHIAIAGAGATGVELAAELHNSTRQLIEFGLDRIIPEKHLKISLIDSAERILPNLPERLSTEIEQQLEQLGIDVLTNERISAATAEGFQTQSGKFIPAQIKVWAAGIKAPDFLAEVEGLETNNINQLLVKKTLQTTNDENIFAFGDCAACPLNSGNGNVPPRAQAAHQQASLLVNSIKCKLKNKRLPEYVYVDYGSLINISRYSTVGSLMGNIAKLWSKSIFIEGVFARLVYLSLYKVHQLALHGFIRVTLLSTANLLTKKMNPRMKLH